MDERDALMPTVPQPGQRRRGWALIAVSGLLLLLGYAISRPKGPPSKHAPPDLALEIVANGSGTIRIGADTAGRLTVLDFFAAWCSDCAETLPRIESSPEAASANWISVGVDASSDEVSNSAKDWGLRRPVVHDGQGVVSAAYGVTVFPTLVIVRPDGVIAASHTGPIATDIFASSLAAAAR